MDMDTVKHWILGQSTSNMLIALSGYLTGYNGTFAFEKPGDRYEDVKYVGMRIFCTLLGATTVPLSFLTVWDLTKSTHAATLSAAFILFGKNFN
ncbi:hypothetical protein M0802_015382 [Mischocyttarus mexicanus]|nr:hypothetical protein M0802_015382 [Mischocyttarus mexicanus]